MTRSQNGRYNSNKECPPGEYFLNWIVATYLIYPGLYATNSNIDDYPGIDPTDSNRTRAGIAFHNGSARFAIGCITFNQSYGTGNNTDFNRFIYPRETNASYLNLLCIDERNAIQSQNDTSSKGVANHNYWRWYDLVKPNN